MRRISRTGVRQCHGNRTMTQTRLYKLCGPLGGFKLLEDNYLDTGSCWSCFSFSFFLFQNKKLLDQHHPGKPTTLNMAPSRPLPVGGHLLTGVAHELDYHRAGGSSRAVVLRPEEDGPPEVIWFVDDDLPVCISSDREEDREVIDEDEDRGDGIPPLSEDDEEDHFMDTEEEEVEEERDDDDDDDLEGLEDWTSEDSGYDTLHEDEEDDDDDNFRPVFPPHLAHLLHREVPEEQLPQVSPLAGPCGPVAEPSRPPEDPAASTSGHGSSTKRSREVSPSEQVKMATPSKGKLRTILISLRLFILLCCIFECIISQV
ncbi:myelin transcription factor 1-like isoform X2 [Trachinotus anak]|uniref:myelin transcription factor 1-like isoform X2 n=1 Tax=Trachinotus anak TaxID=443729 RepID=UPI0039F192D3